MAIYHCSIKIISRGKGKSAVAAAAYRSAKKITNEYDGITHDYTRKGGIVHTEILLPEHAPHEYLDRSILWNAIEKVEKAKNAQLAREIELALPVELSREQNISLARDYVQRNFVSAGMCADICIHDKLDNNPHAHVMLTMRPIEQDSSWGAKSKKEYVLDENGERVKLKNGSFKTYKVNLMDWNDQGKAEEWRAAWAESVNAALERQGMEERVDHRSYERQGIEQLPTVHMGVAASQMEKRGIVTGRGNMNREIAFHNNLLRQILIKLKQFKDWLKEALSHPEPPPLISLLQGVLQSGNQRDRYGRIRDLQPATQALRFLQENNISTMSELRERILEIQSRYDNIRENLRFIERRVNTLGENIRQAGIYTSHQELYAEYQRLKPRRKLKFYDTHRTELMVFEAAQRYFKEHLIQTGFSINDWKNERTELINSQGKVYHEYKALKAKFDDSYTVLRTADYITREAARDMNRPKKEMRSRGMER